MRPDLLQASAASVLCGDAVGAFGKSWTLTLELPAAAQAISPGERPMGSVVRIDVKPENTDEQFLAPVPPKKRPPLLTLTF